MILRAFAVLGALLAALQAEPALAAEPPALKPAAGPLAAKGAFDFTYKKTKSRRAISGMACVTAGACVLVLDEGREARFATLTGTAYAADPTSFVLAEGDPKQELDAEGAAIGGGFLFVVGSHAKARSEDDVSAPDGDGARCKPHPSSRMLLRFPLGANGLPDPKTTGAAPKGDGLAGLIKATALGAGLDLCLKGGKGVDIEGIAFKDDRLFFGFRGPTPVDGRAYVLSAPAGPLFDGAAFSPEAPREVTVGKGRAIRDMQAVDDGFLVLAGPDDRPANAGAGFAVVFWDGASSSRALATLDLGGVAPRDLDGCKDEAEATERKPEAISAVNAQDGWRVAVLSDGLCDGGPMWFDVPR